MKNIGVCSDYKFKKFNMTQFYEICFRLESGTLNDIFSFRFIGICDIRVELSSPLFLKDLISHLDAFVVPQWWMAERTHITDGIEEKMLTSTIKPAVRNELKRHGLKGCFSALSLIICHRHFNKTSGNCVSF